jgi:soluble lytic murein transglycosylase-like protein
MKIKKLLHQPVKPIISYSILGLSLILTLILGYVALTSNLLFFNPNLDIGTTIYPLDSKEYKQNLLEQAPDLVIIGTHNGKPNFKENISKYDGYFKEASKKYKVNCTLIKATMFAESRGNAKIRSGVGAIGLMQLMPRTARVMGYPNNLTDPKINIMAGAKYMAHLKERGCYEKQINDVCDVKKDVKYRLAAYNGGPKCNQPGDGSCYDQAAWECLYYEAYEQTRFYVNKVKANYQHLKNNNWGC